MCNVLDFLFILCVGFLMVSFVLTIVPIIYGVMGNNYAFLTRVIPSLANLVWFWLIVDSLLLVEPKVELSPKARIWVAMVGISIEFMCCIENLLG